MCQHPAHRAPGSPTPLARRRVIGGLAGLAGSGLLAGCIGAAGGGGVDIGEAAAPVLVPPAMANDLGRQAWADLVARTPASRDGAKTRRVRTVADRLLRTIGQNPAAWDVRVFQGREANAFALPGGYIGFYDGMLDVTANDAQVATVMGHEIGHNLENHAAERVATQQLAGLAIDLTGSALGGRDPATRQMVYGALGMGAQFGVFLPYSRNQELEADRLGLTIMADGGYDPRESLAFWRRMQAADGPAVPEFASTHPAAGNRLAQLEGLMPAALARYRAG